MKLNRHHPLARLQLNMHVLTCCSFWLLMQFTALAQVGRVEGQLNDILSYAQTHSLYRDKVNWPLTIDSLHALIVDAKETMDLVPALNYLLEALEDEHGRFLYQEQVVAYYYSGILKPHQVSFDPNVYAAIQNPVTYPLTYSMADAKTGYMRIPGMGVGNEMDHAAAIQAGLCALHQQGAQQWIIDLRYNGGGNINPMAEGLGALIGDGPAGGAKGAHAEQDLFWEIKDGHFVNHGFSLRIPTSCKINAGQKVAILTSLYTASSGEALAILFKGREHTRFFGEKSLGMVTGTGWQTFQDQIVAILSLNYFMDRTGKVYTSYVDVDEEVEFKPGAEPMADPCVQKALAWLNN